MSLYRTFTIDDFFDSCLAIVIHFSLTFFYKNYEFWKIIHGNYAIVVLI